MISNQGFLTKSAAMVRVAVACRRQLPTACIKAAIFIVAKLEKVSDTA